MFFENKFAENLNLSVHSAGDPVCFMESLLLSDYEAHSLISAAFYKLIQS